MSWFSEEEVVERLSRLEKPEPRKEFVHDLERRLLLNVQTVKRKKSVQQFFLQQVGVAAVLLLTVAITSQYERVVMNEGNTTTSPLPHELQFPGDKEVVSPPVLPRIGQTDKVAENLVEPHKMQQAPTEPARQATPSNVRIGTAVKEPVHTERRTSNHPEDSSVRSELERIATSRFQQLVGKEKQQEYEIEDALSSYDQEHGEVVFVRKMKGLPFLEEIYSIGVTKELGVTGVRFQPELVSKVVPEEFPEPNEAISMVEAQKAFAKQLKLYYVEKQAITRDPFFGQPRLTRPTLQYKIPELLYIDARTGDRVEIEGDMSSVDEEVRTSVVPKALELRARSLEEAEELIRNRLQLVHETAEIVAQKDGKQIKYAWQDGFLTVEEATGIVRAFEVVETDKLSIEPTISMEEAERKATSFLEDYLPAGMNQLIRDEAREAGRQAIFRFVPVINDLPVLDMVVKISIDRTNGKIRSFAGELVHAQANLPDPRLVVPPTRAASDFLELAPLQLVYIWPEGQNRPLLVYTQLKKVPSYLFLDATTGELVDTR